MELSELQRLLRSGAEKAESLAETVMAVSDKITEVLDAMQEVLSQAAEDLSEDAEPAEQANEEPTPHEMFAFLYKRNPDIYRSEVVRNYLLDEVEVLKEVYAHTKALLDNTPRQR